MCAVVPACASICIRDKIEHATLPSQRCHFSTWEETGNTGENLRVKIKYLILRVFNILIITKSILGAIHLLRHTGWRWVGVSKSMTHYDRGEGYD